MHDVGVDAVRQGHAGHGGIALTALVRDLDLELRTVKTPCGAIHVGFTRHGVHYLHRAHYLGSSASSQDVLSGRIPISYRCLYSTEPMSQVVAQTQVSGDSVASVTLTHDINANS